MPFLATTLSTVLYAMTAVLQPVLPLSVTSTPIQDVGVASDDGDPLDCPLFKWVMENCTPLPEDQEEVVHELLESMGLYNSGVFTYGGTIFIVTIVSFTECPRVTIL